MTANTNSADVTGGKPITVKCVISYVLALLILIQMIINRKITITSVFIYTKKNVSCGVRDKIKE
jgi:hypothetical protein